MTASEVVAAVERQAGRFDRPETSYGVLRAAVRAALVGFIPDAVGMGADRFAMSREHALLLLRLVTVDTDESALRPVPRSAADAEAQRLAARRELGKLKALHLRARTTITYLCEQHAELVEKVRMAKTTQGT